MPKFTFFVILSCLWWVGLGMFYQAHDYEMGRAFLNNVVVLGLVTYAILDIIKGEK